MPMGYEYDVQNVKGYMLSEQGRDDLFLSIHACPPPHTEMEGGGALQKPTRPRAYIVLTPPMR